MINSINLDFQKQHNTSQTEDTLIIFRQAVMFIIQMQETKILDFIYQEKTTHILIYQVFVYLQIFKTLTEHEVIFYAR